MHITQSKRRMKTQLSLYEEGKNEEWSRRERIASEGAEGVICKIVETQPRTKNHNQRNEKTDFEKRKCEGGENGEI